MTGSTHARFCVSVAASLSCEPVVFGLSGPVLEGAPAELGRVGTCEGFEIVRASEEGDGWYLASRMTLLDPLDVHAPIWDEWHVQVDEASWIRTDQSLFTQRRGDGVTHSLVYRATSDSGPGQFTPACVSWTRVASDGDGAVRLWQLWGEKLRGGYRALPQHVRAHVEEHRPEHAFAPTRNGVATSNALVSRVTNWVRRRP